MYEENKPYLIISKECDEIQINIKRTKPYMKLQQENQQLKLDYELYKDNHIYKNYEVERKDKQLDLYKSVINEMRELITVNTCWDTTTKKAFEILSKVEGSDK